MEAIFLNEKNINVLYEILLQELKISKNSNSIPQIKQIFRNNINFFLANVNLNNSLMELNKLFLKQTIIAINKLIPNLRNEKKINIFPEEINFPHKIEDIKNIRKDLFDDEFNLRKKEFDNIMKKEKPSTINFSDEYRNEKILNMEQLLSEKINERNINIPIVENIELEPKIMLEIEEINIEEKKEKEINKKKKVNFNLLEQDDEIIPEIKTTIYEEQKSIDINNFLQNNSNTLPKMNANNVANFLPMNEFIKKINEIDVLNKKIDILTTLVENLAEKLSEMMAKTQQHQQTQTTQQPNHQQTQNIICENGSYI